MQQLFEGYRGSCVTSVDQDTPNKTSGGSGDADMFSDYGTFLSSRQTHEEKSQLDLYLAEPTRDINEKLDVLDYWSKASARYPEVAAMARDILAIPVSSVASESAFSTSFSTGSAGRPAGHRVGLRAGSGQYFRVFTGPRAGSGHEFFYRVFFGPTRTRPDPRNAQV